MTDKAAGPDDDMPEGYMDKLTEAIRNAPKLPPDEPMDIPEHFVGPDTPTPRTDNPYGTLAAQMKRISQLERALIDRERWIAELERNHLGE